MVNHQRRVVSVRQSNKRSKNQYSKQFVVSSALILIILALIYFGGLKLIQGLSYFSSSNVENTKTAETDKIPPSPPSLNAIPEGAKEASIKITGFAEKGTKVRLFLNGSVVATTLASSEGDFIFENVTLKNGPNSLTATSEDAAGNESEQSQNRKIILNPLSPEIILEFPKSDEEVNSKTIQVKGKALNSKIVTVNDSVAFMEEDGSFSLPVTFSEGENTIRLEATNESGKTTKKEITFTVVLDDTNSNDSKSDSKDSSETKPDSDQ